MKIIVNFNKFKQNNGTMRYAIVAFYVYVVLILLTIERQFVGGVDANKG